MPGGEIRRIMPVPARFHPENGAHGKDSSESPGRKRGSILSNMTLNAICNSAITIAGDVTAPVAVSALNNLKTQIGEVNRDPRRIVLIFLT